jgi:hypothetical protein
LRAVIDAGEPATWIDEEIACESAFASSGAPWDWPDDEPATVTRMSASMSAECVRLRGQISGQESLPQSRPVPENTPDSNAKEPAKQAVTLTDAEPSRGMPPGDGWRFLRDYEIVLEGDEFFDTSSMSGGWKPTRDAGAKAGGMFYRRRVAPVAEMLDAIRGAQDERPVSAAEAAALGPDAPKNRPTVKAKSLPSRPENAATEDRTKDSWAHEIVLRDYRGQPVVIGQDLDGDIGILSPSNYSIIVDQQEVHKLIAWLAEFVLPAGAPFAARRGTGDTRSAQEPVAWAHLMERTDEVFQTFRTKDEAAVSRAALQRACKIVPLFRDPPPPTLTDEEEIERLQRAVIDWKLEAEVHRTRAAAAVAEIARLREAVEITDAERALLERLSTDTREYDPVSSGRPWFVTVADAATLRRLLSRTAARKNGIA